MNPVSLSELIKSDAYRNLGDVQKRQVLVAYSHKLPVSVESGQPLSEALDLFLAQPAFTALMEKMSAAPTRVALDPPAPVVAKEKPTPADFQTWLGKLKIEALEKRGIKESTWVEAFEGVEEVNAEVLKRQDNQPEFRRTIGEYLDVVMSATRLNAGKEMNQAHADLFGKLEQKYGIPPFIMLGIWGLESNYGKERGDFRVADALATLAFAGRRPDYFRSELITALKLIDNGEVDAKKFFVSWAGAMGQPQFMPDSFDTYAVDEDWDDHRDIWNSVPDVLGSMANYLVKKGKWQKDEPWGVEVKLPPGFSRWDLAEINQTKLNDERALSTQDWAAVGLTQAANGQSLSASNLKGWLIFPAGHDGPAFLVYPNFRSILRYNNSVGYALGVAMLGEQVLAQNPRPAVYGKWPADDHRLTREEVEELQGRLRLWGYTGEIDGDLGEGCRAAAVAFQQFFELPVDGYCGSRLLKQLKDLGTTRSFGAY